MRSGGRAVSGDAAKAATPSPRHAKPSGASASTNRPFGHQSRRRAPGTKLCVRAQTATAVMMTCHQAGSAAPP